MDMGLGGTGVLVTGASGGIGSATARAFAAEGALVAAHYFTNRAGAEATGGVAIGADLRDEAQVDRLVENAAGSLGRLDVCVANAGVWPEEHVPVSEMPLDRWNATIEANLTATFLTCRAFLRHVARTGSGALVLVGSTAGIFGEAGHADYAAAKAAISQGLLLSLKNEVVRTAPGARVNVVAPGWTVSPMTAGTLDAATVAEVTATMALRKVATAEDIANAIVWLSSPAAAHVTGQVVTVAGGMEGRTLWPHAPATTSPDP